MTVTPCSLQIIFFSLIQILELDYQDRNQHKPMAIAIAYVLNL